MEKFSVKDVLIPKPGFGTIYPINGSREGGIVQNARVVVAKVRRGGAVSFSGGMLYYDSEFFQMAPAINLKPVPAK